MTQKSLFWGGTTIGDASLAPYTDDQFSDFIRDMLIFDNTKQGVVTGFLSELLVTNPGGATIRVLPGAALVDGKFYTNDANVDNTVVAPGAGSNYYTIVLQKVWATQLVRIVMLGPSAVSAPAVTQVDGATWEIALAEVQITNGSVVTVTDVRAAINKVSINRQGADPDEWDITGANNYVETDFRVQMGQATFTIGAGVEAEIGTITYPIPFAFSPIQLVSVWNLNIGSGNTLKMNSTVQATGDGASANIRMKVRVERPEGESTGSSRDVFVNWLAYGRR